MQPAPFGQVPPAVGGRNAYHQNHLQQHQHQQHSHPINADYPPHSRSLANQPPSNTRRRLGTPYTHVHAANMNPQPQQGESWVEVSSQPSDSYSSSSADDLIITDGLRLPPTQTTGVNVRRRRNTPQSHFKHRDESSEDDGAEDAGDDEGLEEMDVDSPGSSIAELRSLSDSVTTSSVESASEDDEDDDEYDEDDNEEDEEEEEEEEEEIIPGVLAQRAGHLAPPTSGGGYPTRPFPASRRFSREPPQPDHDAALRASLSTLLSCAAAARGLPKTPQQQQQQQQQERMQPIRRGTGVQMDTLTLMPESQRQAMMQNHNVNIVPQVVTAQSPPRRVSNPNIAQNQQPSRARSRKSSVSHQRQLSTASDAVASGKTHRKGKKSHHTRSRAASQVSSPYNLTPANFTYVTLAVSAGALILVSAISFSAGYVLGKEVGREMALVDGGDMVRQAALGRTGGRIMSRGVGSGLRSITVA